MSARPPADADRVAGASGGGAGGAGAAAGASAVTVVRKGALGASTPQ
jgi:hypothetical protein